MKIKIKVVVRRYKENGESGSKDDILRSDVLEINCGDDPADVYDEIYGSLEEDNEDED